MKNIHINNSYNIWSIKIMKQIILQYHNNPTFYLNRSWLSLYIEWYLHNIGYYITLLLCFIPYIKKQNIRCKDVDLNSK